MFITNAESGLNSQLGNNTQQKETRCLRRHKEHHGSVWILIFKGRLSRKVPVKTMPPVTEGRAQPMVEESPDLPHKIPSSLLLAIIDSKEMICRDVYVERGSHEISLIILTGKDRKGETGSASFIEKHYIVC